MTNNMLNMFKTACAVTLLCAYAAAALSLSPVAMAAAVRNALD